MSAPDLDALNQREYRKLLLALKTRAQRLELLLAICDDRNLQAKLIADYETELKAAGVTPFQARLDLKQPSLRATLEQLVAQEPALQRGEPAVVTVLNANELLGTRLTEEPSEQERFFFSLQWTREALRQFAFPIVLWLGDTLATRLAQQAPDFWSWRRSVFEFVARSIVTDAVALNLQPHLEQQIADTTSQESISELEQQIAQLQETAPESPLLITLYNDLGQAYEQQYAYKKALDLYQQALALAQEKNNSTGQALTLLNLGNALKACGRTFQALHYYQESLVHYRKLGDRRNEANTLNQLGLAEDLLGHYRQAIFHHKQSLKIAREIGDRQYKANSLNNLGNIYESLGEYRKALEFYQETLGISREIGDRENEANSLNNLGIIHKCLGQYRQAHDSLQQSLEISRGIGNRENEANSLNNLGNVYRSLGQNQQAIDYYRKTLEIAREIGDREDEANALHNLGLAYSSLGQDQQAIDCHQQSLEISCEIGYRENEANSLNSLGLLHKSQGRYRQAIDLYKQSLEISRKIGDREKEANSLFNLGSALARIDEKWQAQLAYNTAKALYAELELLQKIEQCDREILNLAQISVVETKRAPRIGNESTAKLGDQEGAESRVSPSLSSSPQQQSSATWFLVGLGLALLVWWLVR